MAFLNPLLLYGLAAVSVPVIIHLLNRRRFRKIPWAAMRFLKTSVQRNQRRMQVEDWILLAVRCLLLALLALAFARPAIEDLAASWLQPRHTLAVVIDDSASMAAAADPADPSGPTRFDIALQSARNLTAALPPGSSTALLFGSDRLSPGSVPEPTSDPSRITAALDRATVTSGSSDLFPLVSRAAGLLGARRSSHEELVVITDSTSHAWRQFDRIGSALPPATRVIFTGADITHNLAITDFQLRTPFPAANTPLRFDVTVKNTGTTPVQDIPVSLDLDATSTGESTSITDLAPGGSQTLTLYSLTSTTGFHAATAKLPTDAIPSDDSRSLAFETSARTAVLLVDGTPSTRARDSSTFYLKHAIASPTVSTTTVTTSDLPDTGLSAYSAIVLANVPELDRTATDRISTFVQAGGGLVVFAGDRISIDFYNRELHTNRGLLPVTFGDPLTTAQSIQTTTLDHPLIAPWAGASRADLADVSLTTVLPINTHNAQAVLRTSNSGVLAASAPVGRGRVIAVGTSADTTWSDFPVHPSFVPFFRHLVGAVAGSRHDLFNLTAGTPFRYPVPKSEQSEVAVYPLGVDRSVGTASETLTVDGTPFIDHTATYNAGVFRASAPPVDLTFAVQPDPAEAETRSLSQAQLTELAARADLTHSSTPFSTLGTTMQTTGAELWLPLLVVVIALALAELFLAQRFSRPK
ncbi:MAG: BatA domain-containing protein [Verrucomicrobiales bacterium]|nr:BatA domain-containing protein [Verrucomicrobiales bacterium]